MPTSYVLKVAVNAMNDKICGNELIPPKLVFQIIPTFLILNTDLPNYRERIAIISKANAEIKTEIAERIIIAALNRNISPAIHLGYKIG